MVLNIRRKGTVQNMHYYINIITYVCAFKIHV